MSTASGTGVSYWKRRGVRRDPDTHVALRATVESGWTAYCGVRGCSPVIPRGVTLIIQAIRSAMLGSWSSAGAGIGIFSVGGDPPAPACLRRGKRERSFKDSLPPQANSATVCSRSAAKSPTHFACPAARRRTSSKKFIKSAT